MDGEVGCEGERGGVVKVRSGRDIACNDDIILPEASTYGNNPLPLLLL